VNEHDETQEQVRRLLAAAGSPPPAVPEDVEARLDDVLAGLVAERGEHGSEDTRPVGHEAGEHEPAGVTPLDGRRRRWPQVLVAAAAVSVIALGVGNLVLDSEPAADYAATAEAGSAQDEVAEPPTALSDSLAGEGSEDRDGRDTELQAEPVPPEVLASTDRRATALSARPVRLRSDSLRRDVQLVEDLALAAAAGNGWSGACVRPAAGEGDEWVAVRFEGEPAVLVLRAPAGGRRTAEVFACGTPGAPVASVTVDAR
jgi:hypothetical protein